jgi:hypothetical protein
MADKWTVHEVQARRKVFVEHDGLFPTICTLSYMDFARDIVLKRAELIASAPQLEEENKNWREELEREIQLRYDMFKTGFASDEYNRGGMAALQQLSCRLNLKEPA